MRAFRIAYDGTDYHGFQRQPSVETVESRLFGALRSLGVLDPDAEKPEGYAAAGRTDAGVSALAQTVAFEAPAWLTPRAFNSELPGAVRAWAFVDVPADFHATHDATHRVYTYHLHAPPETVDEPRLESAVEQLSGTHDFADLTPDDDATERTIELSARRSGAFLIVTAAGGGFSRQLVRRLVSLIERVGTGESSLELVDRTLSPSPLPDHEIVAPAPATGLVLSDVTYPDVDFAVDERAHASARRVFRDRQIERETAARVAEAIVDGFPAIDRE